ncbi:MAG: hypothetical protein U0103_25175 [Candidatus Obscuribacterales bacterium]|nr:MAG: hypothetical protein EKK48_29005 [Candidatus Melainabacteria bacterium]
MTEVLSFHSKRSRSQSGSMLALVVAVFLGIVLVFAMFGLSYVRLLGSHHEQVTSIQAAALAAANDLSRIVIEDDAIGFVCLSDYPPTGKGTLAQDGYFLPVRGINTLLATARLDLIIADLLQDPIMQKCAERDYAQVNVVKDKLVDELRMSIRPGGRGKDIDGALVEPLKDAIEAYNSNQIRMNGGKSILVPGSMVLTLGCIEDLTTSTPIPKPTRYANLDSPDKQEGGCYKAYVNCRYKDKDFVFAAMSNATCLVESKDFKENLSDLPYFIPSIVRCDAVQEVEYSGLRGAVDQTRLRATASAEPGVVSDRPLFPGALMLTFPNGSIHGLTTLASLLTNPRLAKGPADRTQQSILDDSPPDQLIKVSLPLINFARPPMGQLQRIAVYDWIRRGGCSINLESLFAAFDLPLSVDGEAHADMLRFNSDGNVILESMRISKSLTLPVSHKQWYAVSGLLAIDESLGTAYDCSIRDFVYQPGRINGGKHAGEPLRITADMASPADTDRNSISEDLANAVQFDAGPIGGAVRPSYSNPSVGVEIKFRKRSIPPI